MKHGILVMFAILGLLIILLWTVGVVTTFQFHRVNDIFIKSKLRFVTQLPISKSSRQNAESETESILFKVSRSRPYLLSRSADVTASCDTRGNLGPCEVIIQSQPGSDWLKDRWQAASDMGGTAIPGHHWVLLDFKKPIMISKVLIDWETAYAKDYRLEARLETPAKNELSWNVIYDATIPEDRQK